MKILFVLSMFFIGYLFNKYILKKNPQTFSFIVGAIVYIFFTFCFPVFSSEIIMTKDGAMLFETYNEFNTYRQNNPDWNSEPIELCPEAITPEQRTHYTNERDLHKREFDRNMKNVEESCWWAPNAEDRKLGRLFWKAVVALGITPGSPSQKIMAAVITLVSDIGLNAMTYFDYIHEQILWAQYHAEQYEWFQHVLDNA